MPAGHTHIGVLAYAAAPHVFYHTGTPDGDLFRMSCGVGWADKFMAILPIRLGLALMDALPPEDDPGRTAAVKALFPQINEFLAARGDSSI